MNKKELVDAVADGTGLGQAAAAGAVDGMFETIAVRLAAGEPVAIPGFGTFEVRERGARTGRNPRTGETIDIAASRVAAFKAGKGLRERVNRRLARGAGR